MKILDLGLLFLPALGCVAMDDALAQTSCTPDPGYTRCVAFPATGSNQSFTFPADVVPDTALVKLWGAGGGGVDSAYWPNQSGGGGGGYTRGQIPVAPGQVVTVVTGVGGKAGVSGQSLSPTYGGGGAGGGVGQPQTNKRGSSGGGMSGVFSGTGVTPGTALLIAGGGGGSSPGSDVNRPATGGGGGLAGGQDSQPQISGRGGTQTAGGAGATASTGCASAAGAGRQFQGGAGSAGNSGSSANFEGGGGGGGGWFGGGGGKCQTVSGTQVDRNNGDGGGGSGYIGGAGVTNASTATGGNGVNANPGSPGQPPNRGERQYVSGVGVGGTTTTSGGGNGGNGLVVIQFNTLPRITISKITENGTGTFSFTGTNGVEPHSITTTSAGTPAEGAEQVLTAASTVTTITEGATPGFALTNIACVGLGSGGTATVDIENQQVTFNAAATAPGAHIRCGFTNHKTPFVQVSKVTRGATGTFSFTGDNGIAPHSITTTSEETPESGPVQYLAQADTVTTITEAEDPDYLPPTVSCTGMASGGSFTASGHSVTLNSAATASGAAIRCTFTNERKAPALEIEKTVDKATATEAGELLTYTITVRNAGNAAQTGVAVTDRQPDGSDVALTDPSGDGGTVGVLDVGETWTYTTTYTVSQEDMDAGEDLINTASATSNEVPTPVSDEATTEVSGMSAMTLTKTAGTPEDKNGDGKIGAGDTITYTFTVENTGKLSIEHVTIADPKVGASDLAVTPEKLAPGDTGTATAVYTLTQEDINAGKVDNAATAKGKDSSGAELTADGSTSTLVRGEPELTLTKSAGDIVDANGDGKVNAGDTITYTFSVENTGTETMTEVTVDDAKVGASGLAVTPSALEPGEVGTATAIYQLTQADVDAGKVDNSATAKGKDPSGTTTPSEASTVSTPIEATASIDLDKVATIDDVADTNGNGYIDAGDTITFTFVVENTGSVTVHNITVDDVLLGLTGHPVNPSTLAPGEKGTATADHVLTQEDIDARMVYNSASADSDHPSGGEVTDEDDVTVPIEGTTAIDLVKTAGDPEDVDGDGKVGQGDTITYTFTVENTGTRTIENATVDDPKLGITGLAVSPASLAPGEKGTATATYTLTQADIDAGKVDNTANAKGRDPSGEEASDNSSISTSVSGEPGLALTKTGGGIVDADGDGRHSVGDTITYTFSVENTGTVTISGVAIDDPKLGITGLAVDPGALAPGETGTATATYALTQADLDAGTVDNTATARGKDPANRDVSADDSETTPVTRSPAMELVKSAASPVDRNNNGRTDAGDTIAYTITVRNSGTVTLSGITVTDVKLGISNAALDRDTLAPGKSGTAGPFDYTLTQADLDAGKVDNTASASGRDPAGTAVTAEGELTTPVAGSAAVELTKTAGAIEDTNGDGRHSVGDQITYTFSVENTGALTLRDLRIDDAKAGATGIPVSPDTLAPGGTGTAAATYTLTQADLDAGKVDNTATVTGKDAADGDVSDEDSETVAIAPASSISLTKSAGAIEDSNGNGRVDAADTITYTFTVENTGTVTIRDVLIDDQRIDQIDLVVTPATLAPGEKGSATARYPLTQNDVDERRVENTATATGKDPAGRDVSGGDTITTPVETTSSVALTKTAGDIVDANNNGRTDAGDTITYVFDVLNDGALTLSDLRIDDARLGMAGVPVEPSTLAPNAVGQVTATYTLTQADVDAGKVDNSASVKGTDPYGREASESDAVSTEITRKASIALTKTAGAITDANNNGRTDEGDTITYSFEVENTGSVTVSNVTVDDAKLGVSGLAVSPGTLAPGEKGSASATYTLTQADVDAGQVENKASAAGRTPSGDTVEGDSSTSTRLQGTPALVLTKTADSIVDANGNGRTDAGDTIAYTLTVENTGSVTVSDITVTDTKLGIEQAAVSPSTLAPGASATAGPFTYTLTQADLDAGKVDNTASTSGRIPSGSEVGNEAGVSVPVVGVAGIAIEKTAGEPSDQTVGSTLTYRFKVTNTGSVGLTGVTIADALEGVVVSGGPIDLAPGAVDSTSFTATYRLTQEDLNRGEVANTATATGTPTNGGDPVTSDPARVTTPIEQEPSLALEKTGEMVDVDGNGAMEAGDTLVYRFKVTNTGNVTLADVQPIDAGPTFNGQRGTGSLGAFSPGAVAIEPGQVQTFEATYTLSQADVDAAAGLSEGVANTATARGYRRRGAGQGRAVDTAESQSRLSLPAAAPSDVTITKQAGLRMIRRGERAPFVIKVTNNTNRAVSGLQVVDRTPAGFRYVESSASIDGRPPAADQLATSGANVIFRELALAPRGESLLRLQMLALGTATPGRHSNRANALDRAGNRLAPEASAAIEIMVEPVFDCGEIIGKVFDDRNGNGYQDEGEPGLPGVRVATVRGALITSDAFGRFHVACADLPEARTGSNFIMKLDPRTLPTGYRLTTENPRVVRLTAGKMTRLDFGAALGRVVRLDLTDTAFLAGASAIDPQWATTLDELIARLREAPATLRIAYHAADPTLAQRRIDVLRDEIERRWKASGDNNPLNIETRTEAAQPGTRP